MLVDQMKCPCISSTKKRTEENEGKAMSFFILLTPEDLFLEVKLLKSGQSCWKNRKKL